MLKVYDVRHHNSRHATYVAASCFAQAEKIFDDKYGPGSVKSIEELGDLFTWENVEAMAKKKPPRAYLDAGRATP